MAEAKETDERRVDAATLEKIKSLSLEDEYGPVGHARAPPGARQTAHQRARTHNALLLTSGRPENAPVRSK